MRYFTLMIGISGNVFRTEWKTLEEAEAIARNNRNLGWECTVEIV